MLVVALPGRFADSTRTPGRFVSEHTVRLAAPASSSQLFAHLAASFLETGVVAVGRFALFAVLRSLVTVLTTCSFTVVVRVTSYLLTYLHTVFT